MDVKGDGKWIRRACAAFWRALTPGLEVRKGAQLAAALTALGWAAYFGVAVRTGLDPRLELVVAVAFAVLALLLAAALATGLLTSLRRLPRVATGLVLGAGILVALPWDLPLGFFIGVPLVLVQALLGGTAVALLRSRRDGASARRRAAMVALLVAGVALDLALVAFLKAPGTDADLVTVALGPAPGRLAAPDPSLAGPYAVKRLYYGSGTDTRRPEYGASVDLRTPTVDGSTLLDRPGEGLKLWLRRRFWRFDTRRLPLNARVFYPQGDGPFPLVLVVHGNHQMEEFSDPGYAYLGELLASRGFILASVDQNFLNASWFRDLGHEKAARGWLLLEHLRQWRAWNRTPGHPFHRKVDLDRIALMGHSRGGEAAATAAALNRLSHYPDDATRTFDYGFGIRSVVALAPVDGQYKPAGAWRRLENVNYLVLHGAHDGDVPSFEGARQYQRVSFTDGRPWFKAELYVYRANHGQFNTVWGRADAMWPMRWLLNLAPLLSGAEQRQVTKVYLSAFLEATLHDQREYVPLFRDHRLAATWLPETVYLSRFQDDRYKLVSDFDEDVDVTTTTVAGGRLAGTNLAVWREERIPYRWENTHQEHNGVVLGWHAPGKSAAAYTVTLPGDLARRWRLGAGSALVLSLAALDEDPPARPGAPAPDDEAARRPIDFTIELATAEGAVARLPLSRFAVLPPPLAVRLTKLRFLDGYLYGRPSEPVPSTFELPLRAFADAAPGFDPAHITTIRLRFDRSGPAVILLDQIGFQP